MPPAQKIISSAGISGVVNLKRSKIPGRRGETKWRKKFAVLKMDTLHMYEGHDENGKGEDESHTVYLSKYKECTYILDKKGRKKPGFTLIPTDPTYEQWMLSCEDINQQEKWIRQLNAAISGNVITITNCNFDELTVQSPSLKHLGKTRPKYKGRRAPSKRPRTDQSGRNGDINSPDEMEIGFTTVDNVNPAKKPRSESTAATSPVKTPDESKASAARTFFRGIGLKLTTALGRQKSIGAKTPQSPEPEGATAMDIAPEDKMSLSGLMRALQRIEEQSGIIVNKAAALRVLFQGTAEDSASLGHPALEVEKGLRSITDTLGHLSLAEELQMKMKKEEDRRRLEAEEQARLKREDDEIKRREEEEGAEMKRQEEAEQRRRDEEEQELQDEEDRKKEEERLKRDQEEQKAKEEQLRLAEEAADEEEKMWQSETEEKTEPETEEKTEPETEEKVESETEKIESETEKIESETEKMESETEKVDSETEEKTETEKTGPESEGVAQDTLQDTTDPDTADETQGKGHTTEDEPSADGDKTTGQESEADQEKSEEDTPDPMDTEEAEMESAETENAEEKEKTDEEMKVVTSPSPEKVEGEDLNVHL